MSAQQGDPEYEVFLLSGGFNGLTLNAHFVVEGVEADGLQVIQTVVMTGPKRNQNFGKLRWTSPEGKQVFAFVDGGKFSPAGETVPGTPYYNECCIIYSKQSMSGSIDIYDEPLAVMGFGSVLFQTSIMAINYKGSGYDKVLASFEWGFVFGERRFHDGVSLRPGMSTLSETIIRHDYPNYNFK